MDVEKRGSATIIATEERLDAVIAPEFKDMVKKMAEEGTSCLVIDLAKTKFIDSSGCGALVACIRALIKNGGEMKIARPSPQARTLFELTRLHKVFEIYDDLDSAINSFGASDRE
jgi:anti-sigma B factor antagonist